jgi:hypothetical protein
MKTSTETDRRELATRTLRRFNLMPTVRSPEREALFTMLRGHVADAAVRAQRTVVRENAHADAIDIGPDVVWARGAGRG